MNRTQSKLDAARGACHGQAAHGREPEQTVSPDNITQMVPNPGAMPAWIGAKSLNCLPTSLRVAAGELTHGADGIFGGLLGPIDPLADRAALAELCWSYIETVYGADCVTPLWSSQTVASTTALAATVQCRLGGAAILGVKSRDFLGYPYWYGSEDPDESHTVYLRIPETGPPDVLEFLDGALSNWQTVFHVATRSTLGGYLRLPGEVELYNIRALVRRGQSLGPELARRKRDFARRAIVQALASLAQPEPVPPLANRDDIVAYLTVSGRAARLRMLALALSDADIWPASAAASIAAPLNAGQVLADRIAVMLLRSLSSGREPQGFAPFSQALSQHLTFVYNALYRMI